MGRDGSIDFGEKPTGKTLQEKIEQFLGSRGKTNTYVHVSKVAKVNREIARIYGLDEAKCNICGLLHDVSAVMKAEDMLAYAYHAGMQIDRAEEKYPFLLHQRLSRVFAEELFEVQDAEVLSAIECHTTLKKNPGRYDMALFIADKLAWDQEGVPPFYAAVHQALFLSLESACLTYIDYIMDHGLVLWPHEWLIDARRSLRESGCTS